MGPRIRRTHVSERGRDRRVRSAFGRCALIVLLFAFGVADGARADSASTAAVASAPSAADCPAPAPLRRAATSRFVRWFTSDACKRARGPSIREPGPDLSNFPNSSFTLPQLRFYLETLTLNLTGPTKFTPLDYDLGILLRFGVTDNIEARVYTGGLAVSAPSTGTIVGFMPLTFDTKLHVAEHEWRHFNISVGLETYVQTTWGSAAFASGTHYSANLLVDHRLPWDLTFEWNLGFVTAHVRGDRVVVPTFQGSLQKALGHGLAVFIQSFRNATTLPRSTLNRHPGNSATRGTVFGIGLQWTVNDRWVLFGDFNVGHGAIAPLLSGSLGVGLAL